MTLAGPVAIGVTPAGAPPACGLATATCGAQSGSLACVDELYANDGACGTTVPHGHFAHFTALPPPNDFQADCFSRGPAVHRDRADLARARSTPPATCSSRWAGAACWSRDGGVPVPRLIRTRIASPLPFAIPDQVFLGSFTPEGGLLPPILEPQLDPTVAAPDVVTFFGSVDAPYTTIRVARRHGTCVGGDADGARCTTSVDCKGGLCETLVRRRTRARSCSDRRRLPERRLRRAVRPVEPHRHRRPARAAARCVPQFCQLAPHGACTSNARLRRRRQRLRDLRDGGADPGAARGPHRERDRRAPSPSARRSTASTATATATPTTR